MWPLSGPYFNGAGTLPRWARLGFIMSAFTFFSRLNSAIHSSSVNAFTVTACTVRSIQSTASPPKK